MFIIELQGPIAEAEEALIRRKKSTQRKDQTVIFLTRILSLTSFSDKVSSCSHLKVGNKESNPRFSKLIINCSKIIKDQISSQLLKSLQLLIQI